MIAIVYSSVDPASVNIAERMKELHGISETASAAGKRGAITLHRIDAPPVQADFLDGLNAEAIVILSKHSSASEVPAMTVHSMGNWGQEARLGGRPRSLSASAPMLMLAILQNMHTSGTDIAVTYEATHHGPLLNTPSAFAELGGTKSMMEDRHAASIVADAVYKAARDFASRSLHSSKTVIGIGGGHYPEKFTGLAVEKGYAFSYIMPKYSIINSEVDSISMLEQAVSRSSERPDLAVIDWKSTKASTRESIIKELGMIGIGYERV